MSWIRLDAAVFQEPRLRACKPYGAIAWIAILTMSKLHDWDGVCPVAAVQGGVLADHLGFPRSQVANLDKAVGVLEGLGLLQREGDNLLIVGWRKFQPDPTGAGRQARFRAKSEAAKRDVTAVTVTDRYVTGQAVSNGDVRDVTGRTDGGILNPAVDVDRTEAAAGTLIDPAQGCGCDDGLLEDGTYCRACGRGKRRLALYGTLRGKERESEDRARKARRERGAFAPNPGSLEEEVA